jgi:iron complex transport system ATP-binding protein
MGPNGVGKSSLIRTIAGLQSPLEGKIAIKTENTDRGINPKNISLVLTDKIAVGNMTGYELISFGRYPYLDWSVSLSAVDKQAINQAIAQVNVKNIIDKKLSELSDGQLQMIMVARALAQDTPIILLDEPTAHLDLNNRVEIMKLLRKLSHKMNKGILVATHELDLALQTADVIWLAGKEKNILTGIPEDLVLNGSFDTIFEFKGFDLKSGKIQHDAHRDTPIYLEGKGHDFLWTKNALERSGFEIKSNKEEARISVVIEIEESKPRWVLTQNNRLYTLDTIAALIQHI